jgi:hypothetical protein
MTPGRARRLAKKIAFYKRRLNARARRFMRRHPELFI